MYELERPGTSTRTDENIEPLSGLMAYPTYWHYRGCCIWQIRLGIETWQCEGRGIHWSESTWRGEWRVQTVVNVLIRNWRWTHGWCWRGIIRRATVNASWKQRCVRRHVIIVVISTVCNTWGSRHRTFDFRCIVFWWFVVIVVACWTDWMYAGCFIQLALFW